MNKLINTLSLFLLSVLTFAEEGFGPESDQQEYGPGDVGGGSLDSPIDNYTYALIAVAVIMIAYLVYKQRQSKIA